MKLTYSVDKMGIADGYTYVGNMGSQRSTLGCVFMHVGGAIHWRSNLQHHTTLTTMKAEYIVSSKTTKEVI